MPDRILIHIGCHKTGTTAIQQTLVHNRGLLQSQGIHYPEVGFSQLGHHGIPKAMNEQDERVLAEVERVVNGLEGVVILSSENFSRSTAEAISALAPRLRAGSIEIVYYQRNLLPLSYLWWSERVKHRLAKPFAAFHRETMESPRSIHVLHPVGILNKWSAAFGRKNVSAYLYDPIPDTAAHFMREVVGTSYQADPTAFGANRSFDPASVELIRFMNEHGTSGLRWILVNPNEAAPLRHEINRLAPPHMRALDLSMAQEPFATLEKSLLESWGDAFKNYQAPAALFPGKTFRVRYLDVSFWQANPDFGARVREVVSAHPVPPNRQMVAPNT